MPEEHNETDGLGRRKKKHLSPQQKYEIFLQLVRKERNVPQAAEDVGVGVDPSTIMKLKATARDGALAALTASKPGAKAKERDRELESAKTEIARLTETIKEQAVKLMVFEGKGRWG